MAERNVLITGGSGFIGTNYVDFLGANGVEVHNVDCQQPLNEQQSRYWLPCDIMDAAHLTKIFADVAPTEVVHLAGRTDVDGRTLEDYAVNIEGTANVLDAVAGCESVERVVIASTQYVCRPGKFPRDDEDYDPHTVYGASKVLSEKITREKDPSCVWTIIRPTNIWGPWHVRYSRELWRVLKKGWYVHPGRAPVRKSYGYVGNVVYQTEQILKAPPAVVDRKVFYVGDRVENSFEWVNAFSRALSDKDVRIVPRRGVQGMAMLGDVISALGIRAPIHSARFRNMTQDYPIPIDRTFEAFGDPPYSLQDGIRETVRWLEYRQSGA